MLISLHLPKTAGTSFGDSLRLHYGERLLEDYDDRPLNRSRLSRRAHAVRLAARSSGAVRRALGPVDCIHGHFLPLKYRPLQRDASVRFVTWLRDPLERLASHYHYWMREFDEQQAGALHRQVVEEQWSFERFCLSPQLRNCYSEFLWGFAPSRFDFIGITERYSEDMARFGRDVLGESLPTQSSNVNPDAPRRSYFEDEALRRRVADYHARDVALYQRVLNSH